ncbi:MAG TPA: flagellar protein FliS [Clostridiales bacterium]|nr:flagellar protein FliS [Clostridiales bacterium]
MTKEVLQGYTARITQASKSELIVIIYELIISNTKEAIKAYNEKDLVTFDKELKQAQTFLRELMVALDYSYELSYDLLSLYIFVNKQFITAIFKKKPDTLDSALSILEKLLVGFEGVSKEDTSGPMMYNTQQLYAGLTYGKGTLNETYIDPEDRNRGFII